MPKPMPKPMPRAMPRAMPKPMPRAMARGGSYSQLEEQTYNYIINANTGKKMTVFGKEGKQYLKNLIKMYQRGSMAKMPPPQTMLEDE